MSFTHKKVDWERFLRLDEYGDIIRSRTKLAICSPETLCNTIDVDEPYIMVSNDLLCGRHKVGELQKIPTLIARKQPKHELVKTSEGREILSRSIFYLDPAVEPNALNVNKLDLIDGEIVEFVYHMCDLFNKVKMVKVVTV